MPDRVIQVTVADKPAAVTPPQRPTAARGGFALLLSFGLVAVLNYGFAILMSWLLPVDQYGVLGVMQAILLIGATAVNAAFPWALTHAIARRRGAPGAFRGAMVGNVVLGLAFAGLLLAAARADWLGLGAQSGPLMLVAGATILVLAVVGVLSAWLQGYLRLDAVGAVRAVEVVVKCVVGTALVLYGTSALGVLGAFLVGAAVSGLLAFAFVRAVPRPSGGGWGGREMYASAGPFFVGMFGLAVLVNLDIIGLKLFSSADAPQQLAGQYQAAVALGRVPIYLTLALFNAVFPYVAEHSGRSGLASVYARLALKYTVLFIVAIDLVFVAIPDPIIRLFFSPAYDASAGVLVWVAVGTILLTLVHGFAILLQAGGGLRLTTIVLPIGVAVEVLCLAWLVPTLGPTGAALALVAAGAVAVVLLGPTVRRIFGLRVALRQAIGYAISVGALGFVLRAMPHADRVGTLLALVAGACAYLLALIVLGILNRRDLEVLAGGLGPRASGVVEPVARVIERLRLVPLAD